MRISCPFTEPVLMDPFMAVITVNEVWHNNEANYWLSRGWAVSEYDNDVGDDDDDIDGDVVVARRTTKTSQVQRKQNFNVFDNE